MPTFFEEVLKHPKKMEKLVDKRCTPEVMKNAYNYAKQGTEQEKKLNQGGFYLMGSHNKNISK